ncbi:hypothetical protein F442_20946 [Phytophthora nicotianae P10297]|uniref:DDE Tnp4 domain-containing protein n=1 Tax=Phytophthora nicotianae P10297 TaxID=1317064 RepID=W2Y4E0_PHYNI|nr:hypothetical protein F442_20946 [Phytophthora nicotianae P10297]
MATDDGNKSSVLLLVLALAVEGRERKKKRQRGPNYLTRVICTLTHELEPLARNGKAFIKTTGFDVQTFNYILERFEPSDGDVENAYYNVWPCSRYCSTVMAFSPDRCLIFCSLNAPGNSHDAAVARHLYDKLLYRTPDGFFAIADTAFKAGSKLH